MRKHLYGLAAALGLMMAAIWVPADASPSPAPVLPGQSTPGVGPLFTCVSGSFFMFNNPGGDAYFNNSRDRLTMGGSTFTDFCGNKNTFLNELVDLIGENNCLTYAGPKTGTAPLGYVDKTTCNGSHASELWTLYSNGEFKNSYTGSAWCLDGPSLNGVPFMEHCSTGDSGQVWTEQGN